MDPGPGLENSQENSLWDATGTEENIGTSAASKEEFGGPGLGHHRFCYEEIH